MKNEIITACYELITALINGACQGIVVTLLVAAGLRFLGRTNAATRHAVWFATLLLLALIIPAHWLRERRDAACLAAVVQAADSTVTSIPPMAVSTSTDDALETAQDLDVYFAPLPQNSGAACFDLRGEPSAALYAASGGHQKTPIEEPARLSIPAAIDADVVTQAEANEAQPEFLAALKEKVKSAGERFMSPVSRRYAAEIPLPLALGIPLIWLVVAGGKVSILFRQMLRIRRLKRNSALPSPELDALFHLLREKLHVRREVTLKVSQDHKSAIVLGFLKPAILLPADTGRGEAEHILGHELAHVRRRDDWANLVQQFIKAAFFFHPAICWISKRISLEREIACDDEVLRSTRRPRAYALLLADLAGRLHSSILAPGVLANQSQLKQRIDMILNPNRNTSPGLAKARLGLLASVAAAVAVAAIYSAPRVVFAQSAAATAPVAPTPPVEATVASEDAAPAAAAALPDEPVVSTSSGAGAAWAAAPEPPVAPGPKYKPGAALIANPPAFTPQGPVLVHPIPPIAPVPAVPSTTPAPGVVAVSPAPAVAVVTPAPRAFIIAGADSGGLDQPGQPPRASRRGRDASLEERLDRLEKMVESLVAQQKNKPEQFEYHMKGPGGQGWTLDRKSDGANNYLYKWDLKQPELEKRQAELDSRRAELEKKMAELQKQNPELGPKDKAKLKELADQQAKMAAEQAKMARDAEQMARDAQRAARNAQQRGARAWRDGARQQLDAMRRQRETLQKEMEKLDRQIEKLERDQARSEDEQDNELDESDSRDEKPAQRSSSGDPDTVSNNDCSGKQPAVQIDILPRVAVGVRGL
jgi:beta-lactamase regulating signal transducer with metallopeptidase domain